MNGTAPADSFSAAERRLLAPARRVLRMIYAPVVWPLARLGVPPNAVSLTQIPLAVAIAVLLPTQPRLAFALFVATLALDGVDGALARATGRSSRFGAFIDQYADHAREVIVVAALAAHGALHPSVAVLYALLYPGLNVTLHVCNTHGVAVPFAVKSYLTFYPALFLYLWFGTNLLDAAGTLTVGFMAAGVANGVWRLRRAMD